LIAISGVFVIGLGPLNIRIIMEPKFAVHLEPKATLIDMRTSSDSTGKSKDQEPLSQTELEVSDGSDEQTEDAPVFTAPSTHKKLGVHLGYLDVSL